MSVIVNSISSLNLKDWIEILGIISGSIFSVIAICVAFNANKIAKQSTLDNKKMIEENLRPNITVYPHVYNAGSMFYALVIKNVGPTTCKLDKFSTDYEFFNKPIEGYEDNTITLSKSLEGLTLGPNQSKIIHIDSFSLPSKEVIFEYKYSWGTNSYSDQVSIYFNAGVAIPTIVAARKDKEIKYIYETLLEFLRINL